MSNLVADLQMVGVAWTVRSSTRRDYNDLAFEGVVVAVDRGDQVDMLTGEVSPRVIFRCRSPFMRAPNNLLVIDGDDVSLPHGCDRPERNRVHKMIRNLANYVGQGANKQGSKWLTASELDALTDAFHLAQAVEAR